MHEPTMSTKTGIPVSLIYRDESHTDDVYNLVDKSRQHLSNLVWVAEATRDDILQHMNKPGVWLIRVNREKIAGVVELRPVGDWLQVGYWVAEEFSEQGVATQALRLALTTCSLDAHLFACVKIHNLRSQLVLLKSGYMIDSVNRGWITFTIVNGRTRQLPVLPVPRTRT